MFTMSRWKVIATVVGVVLTVIGVIANVVTISQFGFYLWEPITNGSKIVRANPSARLESPSPTLTITATPTPVPPLDKQLEVALSVSSTSSRNEALFLVTQNAVLLRDYRTAIRAASSTPSRSAQAENLAFVVVCAIEDELYDLAAEAADKISVSSERDRLKIEVIESRKNATSDYKTRHEDVIISYVDRDSMNCFSSLAAQP